MVIQRQISVAILGVGMMGQEHISYMQKYSQISIKFLCDTETSMMQKALSMISSEDKPECFSEEKNLLDRVGEIDLLVIATPNFMHTPHLLRWAKHPICILVEKPVAISEKQVLALQVASPSFQANIWVAMEYRFMPAVQKLYQLLPMIGQIKNVTIRENRFPFLTKVGDWNKDVDKSGDTLVEKCCHFFDLFRLLSGQEMRSCTSKIQRGLLDHEYGYDRREDNPFPIIDSAYVLLDFLPGNDSEINLVNDDYHQQRKYKGATPLQQSTLGCLELCMFADGSRHQEEIIVTGMKGRLEAYLPENKVFHYTRPSKSEWVDRSQPPPSNSIKEEIIDCSILSNVYSFADEIPQHAGHHYCSTAVEWKYLIDEVHNWQNGGKFVPQVSLEDGIAAVEMGMKAQANISNTVEEEGMAATPLVAYSTKSSEHLLNLAIEVANISITTPKKQSQHNLQECEDDYNNANCFEEEKGW